MGAAGRTRGVPREVARGRDRVVAGPAPGMAAEDAPRGEPAALHGAVALDRLERIGGAARGIAAARPEQRRDEVAVEEEQRAESEAQDAVDGGGEATGEVAAPAGRRFRPRANSASADARSASRSA